MKASISKLSVVVLGLLAAGGAPSVALSAPPEKPNIIMVVWDTTRADHLTPYGYKRDTTPNLAKIAADSTVFDFMEAGGSWTIPSVASLFSGMFSFNHNVGFHSNNPGALPESVVTLAESLKDTGYTTGMFTAQSVILGEKGLLQGFDVAEFKLPYLLLPAGLEFMKNAGDKPYFLVLYWQDPHSPYTPPPPHDLWRDPSQPPVNVMGGEGAVKFWSVNSGEVTLSDAQYQQLRDRYDGELHLDDSFLGELWRDLTRKNQADQTLFIFTSDHGEAFNDSPRERLFHVFPYRCILRVPLIMRLPGRLPATRVSQRVRNLDIYPTILELIGGEPPRGINGRSLMPVVKGREKAHRSNAGHSEVMRYFSDGDYKYVQRLDGQARGEVFDLKADPDELEDLAGQKPALVQKLHEKMEKFQKDNKIEIEVLDAAKHKLKAEELERLKALGYVQ